VQARWFQLFDAGRVLFGCVSERALRDRLVSAAGLELLDEHAVLRGPRLHGRSLRQSARRRGHLLAGSGWHALQSMHHWRLLQGDGAVLEQRAVCEQHGVFPALRGRGRLGGAMSDAVLHGLSLQHLVDLRGKQVPVGLFLDEVGRPKAQALARLPRLFLG